MSPPCTLTTSFSITETVNGSHSFTIQGYSLAKGLGIGKYIASDTFTAGGYQWAIYFYPDGKNPEDNSSYVSVFIALAGEGTDVRALFELTLIDQSGQGKHKVHSHFDRSLESGPFTLKNHGSMWGYKRFFRREMLESSNFLKDDCLKIDCTVGVVVSPIDCSGLHSMKVPESDIGCILMDNNDLRPTAGQGSEPPVETGCDWRTQLTPYIRERVVNKILEHLKRHLPFSGQVGLQELKKIAIRFEEKVYTAAANKNDYLRKISMKLLTMESKFQTKNPNSLPSNSSSNTNIPLDSGEVCNQGQPLSMPISANQSQGDQQMISQNNMESSGVQSCASLPPVSGVSQTCIPSVVGQNSTMPRIPQKSAWNSSGPSNMSANPQQHLYYQQQLLKQKLQQQGIFQHPFVLSQMPTCQQSGLQRPNIPLQQQIPQNVIDQQNQLLQLQLMQSQLRLQGHLSQPHMHKSSLFGGSTFQQNKMNSAVGPLQQNNVSAQSGVLISQPNIPLQSNPNILKQQLEQILHPQHLKQQQHLMKQQQQQFTQQTKQYLKQQKLLHLQLFLLLLVLLLELWRLFSFC